MKFDYPGGYISIYLEGGGGRCKTMVHRKPVGGGGGGGGLSFFSSYVGSGPASAVHQKKKNIRNFKHPPKRFEILATSKNIPEFCTIDLKKDHKMHRNDP